MHPNWKVTGEPVIPVMFVCLHGYLSDGYYIWGQVVTADTGSPAYIRKRKT
jgi:hypothetical protein